MDANKRLEEVLRHTGLNANSLSKEIDVPKYRIYNILQGRTQTISYEIADKIVSHYATFSKDWLLSGEGEMLRVSDSSNSSNRVVATPLPDKESYEFAQRLGMEIVPEYTDHFRGGGDGSLITTDSIDAYWGLPNVKADIVAEVDGDSMYPKYPPGSKVALREIFFDPSAPTVGIPFGEVFGITLDNGDGNYLNFIKRLRRHPDPKLSQSYWICQSENSSKYDDFDIEVSKVRHLFVVVASIHLNRM